MERLAQANPHIFDSVMVVDVEIPSGMHFEVEKPVPRHHAEHVVEERDTGVNGVGTTAIEVKRYPDVGFGSTAMDAATAFHDGSSSQAIKAPHTPARRHTGAASH